MSDIENIKALILKITPDFISDFILNIVNSMEKFRMDHAGTATNEAVFYFFSHKLAFYGAIAVVLFFILRFIWRQIF